MSNDRDRLISLYRYLPDDAAKIGSAQFVMWHTVKNHLTRETLVFGASVSSGNNGPMDYLPVPSPYHWLGPLAEDKGVCLSPNIS